MHIYLYYISPAGALVDLRDGNHDLAFYVHGAFFIIAALMLLPLNSLKKWEQRKAEKGSQYTTLNSTSSSHHDLESRP